MGGGKCCLIIDSFPEKADVVRPKDVGPVLDRHFFDADQEEMKTDEAAICQYKGEITKAKKVARQKKIAKLAGLAALVIFAFAGLAIIIANSYVTLPFVAVISSMNIAATVITSLFLSALSLSAAKKLHELRKKRVWDWKLVKL